MSRYSDKVVTELVNAAYGCVTGPSPAAYRKGNATHGVGRQRLRRLLDALATVDLSDTARPEVEVRIAANQAANDANAAYHADWRNWTYQHLAHHMRMDHSWDGDLGDDAHTMVALQDLHYRQIERDDGCPA